MSWFPLMIDLADRPCLVAGGGRIALHKTGVLLSFGARVTVVAKECLPEFAGLSAAVIQREVRTSDLGGMALAVDATADRDAGELLARECGRLGIPLNVVDRPALCSFIFPAILRRGSMTAAFCTGGASPTAAAWARDRLDEVLPDRFEEILEQLGRLRLRTGAELEDGRRRAALLSRCFAAAIEKGGPLSQEELRALWEGKG